MMIPSIVTQQPIKVKSLISNFSAAGTHSKLSHSIQIAVGAIIDCRSLQVSQIGTALAKLTCKFPKHCIKQVDRLLSNENLDVIQWQYQYARSLIANRRKIFVAMDWTVFAKDAQMTLTLRLVTRHGRTTPLLCLSEPIKIKVSMALEEVLYETNNDQPLLKVI